MKTTIFIFLTSAILFFVLPYRTLAEEVKEVKTANDFTTETIADAKANINKMVERVKEINELDFKTLERKEKKELRKEVRSIRKDLKAYSKSDSPAIAEAAAKAGDGGGLYISGGALIIILILIILL